MSLTSTPSSPHCNAAPCYHLCSHVTKRKSTVSRASLSCPHGIAGSISSEWLTGRGRARKAMKERQKTKQRAVLMESPPRAVPIVVQAVAHLVGTQAKAAHDSTSAACSTAVCIWQNGTAPRPVLHHNFSSLAAYTCITIAICAIESQIMQCNMVPCGLLEYSACATLSISIGMQRQKLRG